MDVKQCYLNLIYLKKASVKNYNAGLLIAFYFLFCSVGPRPCDRKITDIFSNAQSYHTITFIMNASNQPGKGSFLCHSIVLCCFFGYDMRQHGLQPSGLFDHWTSTYLDVKSDREYLVMQPYTFLILEPVPAELDPRGSRTDPQRPVLFHKGLLRDLLQFLYPAQAVGGDLFQYHQYAKKEKPFRPFDCQWLPAGFRWLPWLIRGRWMILSDKPPPIF